MKLICAVLLLLPLLSPGYSANCPTRFLPSQYQTTSYNSASLQLLLGKLRPQWICKFRNWIQKILINSLPRRSKPGEALQTKVCKNELESPWLAMFFGLFSASWLHDLSLVLRGWSIPIMNRRPWTTTSRGRGSYVINGRELWSVWYPILLSL